MRGSPEGAFRPIFGRSVRQPILSLNERLLSLLLDAADGRLRMHLSRISHRSVAIIFHGRRTAIGSESDGERVSRFVEIVIFKTASIAVSWPRLLRISAVSRIGSVPAATCA